MAASYSLRLLSVLETYGPKRTNDYERLPKWRNATRRPPCQDAVTLLRKQIEARRNTPTNVVGYPTMGSNRRGLSGYIPIQPIPGTSCLATIVPFLRDKWTNRAVPPRH
jgi:hypothetical protein